jgi:amino acid transporter
MWDTLVTAASAVAVVFNLVVTGVFIAIYAREPWRRTWFGQSIMILAIAVLIFSALGTLATFWPDYPFREEIRLLGRVLIAIAMTQRLVVLIRLRRDV